MNMVYSRLLLDSLVVSSLGRGGALYVMHTQAQTRPKSLMVIVMPSDLNRVIDPFWSCD